MTAASETAFRIQRWHNDILVPFEGGAADDLRRRVDVALEAELAQALSGVLDGAMAADGSIVFVRRLDFDWTIDAAWDATDIARQCALALTREVVAELASPSSGNVVRFDTRADYLAAYVVARATSAATSWLYAAFDGWSALPASAAIRSALCADPDAGLAALRTLGRSSLMAVASALADADALQIVAQLAAATSSSDAALPTLDACLSVAPPRSLVERPACGVWLLAQTTALLSAAAITQTGAVVAALHRSAERRGLALDENLLRALRDDHGHLSALIAATAGTRANLDRVATGIVAQEAGASTRAGSIAHTPFGGVFFLLDDLDQEEQMPSAVTLAVLGYAVNGQNWRRVFDDPFWRDRFGVAPAVSAADVVEERNTDAGTSLEIAAHELLGRFRRRLRGFAASGGDYVRKNFLSTHAAVELEPDRVVVTLSRPPLDLVLRMAGVNRGIRRWPWLDPRPFLFFSEDA